MKSIVYIAAIIFVLAPLSAHAATVIGRPVNALGMTAYWSFNSSTVSGSSVSDLSGNGYTMTLHGSTAASGRTGEARLYNGSSDYAVAGLGTQPSSVSVSLWFNANSTAEQSLLDFQDSATPITSYHMTVLGIKNNALYASYWNISNLTSSLLSTGRWYHAVLTYDNTTHVQNLYLNGVLQSANTGTWSGPGTLYVYLAQRQQSCSFNDACGDNATFFNGSIDDVRVYSRALTAGEVKALYGGTTRIVQSSQTQTTIGHSIATAVSRGLVGYWTFDGGNTDWRTNTTADASGQSSAATLVGLSTTTSPVAGKTGQALRFAGSGQYVSATAAASATTYTVSAWIRYRGATPISAIKVALSYGSGAAGSTLWMGYASDGTLAISNSSTDIKSSSLISPTSWHHVAAVVSGGTLSAYMDGVLVNTASMGSRAANTLLVGEYVSLIGSFSFPGSVDDVRVYSRALSASEVWQLYMLGGPVPPPPPLVENPAA